MTVNMTTRFMGLPKEMRDAIYEETWDGTVVAIGPGKINLTFAPPLRIVGQEVQDEYEEFCETKVLKHLPTITCNVVNFNFLRVMQLISAIEKYSAIKENNTAGLSDFVRLQDGTTKRQLLIKLSFSGYRDPETLVKFFHYLKAQNRPSISIVYEIEKLDVCGYHLTHELTSIRDVHPHVMEIFRSCIAFMEESGGT